MQRAYRGAESGPGAIYEWSSRTLGTGRITIIESQPAARIRMTLEMFKPWAGTNDIVFTFELQGAQTVVSWSMAGKIRSLSRIISVFVSMDRMLGGDFARGLARLKSVAENPPAA